MVLKLSVTSNNTVLFVQAIMETLEILLIQVPEYDGRKLLGIKY